MNYTKFKYIITTYKNLLSDFRYLHTMGFDFYDGQFKLETHTEVLLDFILNTHFNQHGVEFITNYIFQSESNENLYQTWNKTKKFLK